MNTQEPAQARANKRKKTARIGGFLTILAEREGFEPSLGYYPKHAFQAGDFISIKRSNQEAFRALSCGQNELRSHFGHT